ncbi:Uncharacterised protein [Chlamydia trachomatis]|nr:Uncharacterised protein [Chlamydia trachomatis]
MIAPLGSIQEINRDIKEKQLTSLPEINHRVRALHKMYYEYEWDWSYDLLCRWYDIRDDNPISAELIRKILKDWIDAVLAIDKALLNDAHKEYNIIGRVNFGVKNLEQQTVEYTDQIEAEYQKNPIVLSVLEHISRKKRLYETVLEQLKDI